MKLFLRSRVRTQKQNAEAHNAVLEGKHTLFFYLIHVISAPKCDYLIIIAYLLNKDSHFYDNYRFCSLQRWSLTILHEEKMVKQTLLKITGFKCNHSSTFEMGEVSETKWVRGVAQVCEQSPSVTRASFW